jgi:hypothetical protein
MLDDPWQPRQELKHELAHEPEKVSVAQRGWLEVLGRSTGLEVRLWRPGDWTEIVELLQR